MSVLFWDDIALNMAANRGKGTTTPKAKQGLGMFSGFDKMSRIVNFGTELLTQTNNLIQTNNTLDTGSKSYNLISPEKDNKSHSKSGRKKDNSAKHLPMINQHILMDHSKNAAFNGSSQTKAKSGLFTHESDQERTSESYSKQIFELDHDPDKLETSLDDPGVFRTDGVGGKSIPLSDVKSHPCQSKQKYSKDSNTNIKIFRPPALTIVKNGLASNAISSGKRASSVLSVSEFFERNPPFRNKSKSESHYLKSGLVLNGGRKYQKPQHTHRVKRKDGTGGNNSGSHSTEQMDVWTNKLVDMVTVCTQTEEEYTGELIVSEINDSMDIYATRQKGSMQTKALINAEKCEKLCQHDNSDGTDNHGWNRGKH